MRFLTGVLLLAACAEDANDAGQTADATSNMAADDAAPVFMAPDFEPPDAAMPDALPPDAQPADARACTPRPLAECFQGVAFADCGGDGEPAVHCIDPWPDEPHCLWFSGGCPAQGYPVPCPEPGPIDMRDPEPCAIYSRYMGVGFEPWTRERAMNLTLEVDPELERAPIDIECGPCGVAPGAVPPEWWPEGQCLSRGSMCDADIDDRLTVAIDAFRPTFSLPGLVPVWIYDPDYFQDHVLVFELDYERQRARLCFFEATDEPTSPGLPTCAADGYVAVDRVVDSLDEDRIHGRFDVVFDTFTVTPGYAPFVTGLHIRGAF